MEEMSRQLLRMDILEHLELIVADLSQYVYHAS